MADTIIGRTIEQEILRQRISSDSSELIAIYGRRRIGKTFLVRQYFNDAFSFYSTGIYQGTKKEQLGAFNRQLEYYSGRKWAMAKEWFEAFAQLREYLESLNGTKPLVVFLDELPWMDTQKSRFIKAFEYFWNSWGATNNRLKLIVCGSATTWMRENMLSDKGGLYNRTTRSIYLAPFTLHETEQYLLSRGISWNRYQIAECYMVLGGTPLYLQMLERNLSLTQNVDNLFFIHNAPLAREYDFLFRSLFNDAALHRQIIETLAGKAVGMTRTEIIASAKIEDGGALTKALRNLSDCEFIRQYTAFGKTERGTIYQLTDLFTLFHLRYVKGYRGQDENHWQNMIDSPSRRAWSGYSFEQLCLHHIRQIKQKLGISGIQSDVCAWKGDGGQIDLLIDRRDQTINLCEMKFSQGEFAITRQYDEHLRGRAESFRSTTKTRKALHQTFVTTYGVKKNMYSGNVQSEVILDDLFAE
ncbi:MAG: ATP-binding protein [Prevotellaceae bacterium]|nr:ATP-binding protein [Prevotellaceae bacterium]MDO4932418.1 ATP-binding protein [Prevotellaceae bacterium]